MIRTFKTEHKSSDKLESVCVWGGGVTCLSACLRLVTCVRIICVLMQICVKWRSIMRRSLATPLTPSNRLCSALVREEEEEIRTRIRIFTF